jgi:hypothetical protein
MLAHVIRVIAFLTVLENDPINSCWLCDTFYCCCHHHMNANELWLCMIMLVIILE